MGPYRDAPVLTRTCPRCAAGLTRRTLADAHIEECRNCKGVFVEHELVERIVDALDLGGEVISTFPRGAVGPAAEPQGGPTYVKCPRCAVVMNRRQFATGAKVVIDICAEHGMWFDAAELRAVADFAAGGGMERAASRDAAERARREAEKAKQRPPTVPGLARHVETDDGPSFLADVLGFFARWR